MPDSDLRQEITRIASQFSLFQSILCAEAIQLFLMTRGIPARYIRLFTGSTEDPFCNIYHEALQRNISTNGYHEAIALVIAGQELIFDNIHPEGISRVDWMKNLYCPAQDFGGDFQITETSL